MINWHKLYESWVYSTSDSTVTDVILPNDTT